MINKISENKAKKIKNIVVVFLGSIVGFINGMLGGGGGSLVVPIYQSLLNMEQKKAHANAIITILPLCIVSSIVYVFRGNYNYYNVGLISIGVFLGGVLGTFILKKANNDILTLVFYVIMFYAGIRSFL